MTYQHIVVETRERVGLVRLNRPQRMNALNDALAVELKDALERFDADDAIAAIVITGNDKAFAAGADIGAMAEWDYAEGLPRQLHHAGLGARAPRAQAGDRGGLRLRARRRLRARDGLRPHHRGGHGEIRPARDHDRHDAGDGRHAAAAARRGQGEGDGLVPDGPDDRRRRGRAERARRARRRGRQASRRRRSRSPRRSRRFSLPVVLKIKEAVNRAYESSLAEGLLFERREFHATFALDDQKEGMRAFVEKSKPVFRHR